MCTRKNQFFSDGQCCRREHIYPFEISHVVHYRSETNKKAGNVIKRRAICFSRVFSSHFMRILSHFVPTGNLTATCICFPNSDFTTQFMVKTSGNINHTSVLINFISSGAVKSIKCLNAVELVNLTPLMNPHSKFQNKIDRKQLICQLSILCGHSDSATIIKKIALSTRLMAQEKN